MNTFPSFLAVAALAVAVPGPDTFTVLRTALVDGARAGTWAAAGSAVGNLVWGAASALGVAALLQTSATGFSALKLLGAAYLVALGVQALRATARGDALTPTDATQRRDCSLAAAFRRGLASDVLNVKVGLFWTALVPQFAVAHSSALLVPAMVLAMGCMVFAWLTAYAHGAAHLSRTLRRRRSARAVNATVGAAFVALGGRLAVASH